MIQSTYEIDFEDGVVVLASGFGGRKSTNSKTGGVIQLYQLWHGSPPLQAVKDGDDAAMCRECPHRGGVDRVRTCYVNLGQAATGMWRKWKAGGYERLGRGELRDMFAGKIVRFGAYGDPALINREVVDTITSSPGTVTIGYTRRWSDPAAQWAKDLFMASCDSGWEREAAVAMGWKTFRVLCEGEGLQKGEIMCPHLANPEKVRCETCRLCSSRSRKSLAVFPHGARAAQFVRNRRHAPEVEACTR